MAESLEINSISQVMKMISGQAPEHPLVVLVDMANTEVTQDLTHLCYRLGLYGISLKSGCVDYLKYGRGHYDFSEGVLSAMEPGQMMEIDGVYGKGEITGWALFFHPDLLAGSNLQQRIREYGFFAYEANEALHLSENEKASLTTIAQGIAEEYRRSIDDFSRPILVSAIELLLNHIDRYFNRQFITRNHINTHTVSRFKQALADWFDSDRPQQEGLISVQSLAEMLHLSPGYMSDLLKKETGRNASEMIHDFVIEKACHKLLHTQMTVSEIAWSLGFEYPQYFSRSFKKKTGMTPGEYRKLH